MTFDSLKKLLVAVKADKKKGIDRLYDVDVKILSITQDKNRFGERYPGGTDAKSSGTRSSIRLMAKSLEECGTFANAPLARFHEKQLKVEVVTGNTRCLAAKYLKRSIAIRIKLPNELSLEKARLLAIAENKVRFEVRDYARIMQIMRNFKSGVSVADIAKERSLSRSSISHILMLGRDKYLMQLLQRQLLRTGSAVSVISRCRIGYKACQDIAWKNRLLQEFADRAYKVRGNFAPAYNGPFASALRDFVGILTRLNTPVDMPTMMLKMNKLQNTIQLPVSHSKIRSSSTPALKLCVAAIVDQLKSRGITTGQRFEIAKSA